MTASSCRHQRGSGLVRYPSRARQEEAGEYHSHIHAARDTGALTGIRPRGPLRADLHDLPPDDYLAGARGEDNRLLITGADGQEWRVRGKGAGRWPTAEAVIADLLGIHAHLAAVAASPSRHGIAARNLQRLTPAATAGGRSASKVRA